MAYGTSIEPLVFFFSQNYTEEQISRRRTETLSQPITQSISANVKGSGSSLSCSSFFLTELHRRTDFTKAHRDVKSTDITEPLANVKGSGPSPNPSPAGKGRSM